MRMGGRGRPRGAASAPDRGQATVEAALLLPIVALVLLVVVQVGIVVHARVMVTHAAREGARIAAVGGSDNEIREAVAVAGDLPVHRFNVEVYRSDKRVTVEVVYHEVTAVPLVGEFFDSQKLTSTASMRLE